MINIYSVILRISLSKRTLQPSHRRDLKKIEALLLCDDVAIAGGVLERQAERFPAQKAQESISQVSRKQSWIKFWSRVTSVQTRCILETSHAFFKTSLADSGYASLACGWSRRPPRRQRWRLICWCPKMAISWGEISDILYFHGDIVSYRYNLMIYYITNYFWFLWNRLPKNPIVNLSHFTQTHIEK